ncbi:MAG: UbiA family prenyltransferase [Planctomycetes bacterium]|nr:UbiA family prenyltransferase [Planctomycetota bacterium]
MTDAASGPRRTGVRSWLSLIRFAHTVFALPFALAALLVASDGRPSPRVLLLVLVAMVCARSAAMAYNRWADRDVDALNPRTRHREIPAGVLAPRRVLAFVALSSLGFVAAAWALGPACLLLSVPTLAWLLGYSHAKRFTALAHLWLGTALGLAAPAAWLAVRGVFTADLLAPAVLGAGVALWVAGFDVLYACQDDAFDRAHGLRSIPARLGRARALALARGFHALAILGFAAFGPLAGLGAIHLAGVGCVAALLIVEHRLVRPDDLDRIDLAFFTMNGVVGLAMLGFVAADVYLG